MAGVTLEMLQSLVLQVLDEQRATRLEMRAIHRECGDIQGLTLALSDKVTRLGRDMHEIKDGLWIMLKSEIMGRSGSFETQVDSKLDVLPERIAALEARQDPR
jgi:hypothetical protein